LPQLAGEAFFLAIGWWRFVNQPESTVVFSSAAVHSWRALFSTEPSKLLERLVRVPELLLRGRRGSGDSWGSTTFGMTPPEGVLGGAGLLWLSARDSAVMSLVVGVGISSYWLISVAEEVRVDRSPRRSVLVQTIPAFSLRPNEAMAEGPGTEGDTREGISEARRCDWSVGRGAPTKSEYLRFE
jgi:hypothetical protein